MKFVFYHANMVSFRFILLIIVLLILVLLLVEVLQLGDVSCFSIS